MKKTVATIFLTALTFGALAFAQSVVNQGKPGTQGPWPVTGSFAISLDGGFLGSVSIVGPVTIATDGGFLGSVSLVLDGGYLGTTGPVRCATITSSNTVVGTTATSVPAAAQAGRIYVTICDTAQNAGTRTIKCRADGTPVFAAGNPGEFLEQGDCFQYPINASQTISCIASAASTNVLAFECTP